MAFSPWSLLNLFLQVANICRFDGQKVEAILGIHPENPRYLVFRGKPLAPITSTEHFGAVMNLGFDTEVYLNTLASANFTLTQTWIGSYVEPDSDVGPFNTLDPKPDMYIAPWSRSGVPGNAKGGEKFDLTRFNHTFFDRLEAFVAAAGRRGIVVEIGLFGGYEQMHENIWHMSPFHPQNNINGYDSVNQLNVYGLNAPKGFTELQIATVTAVARALQHLDNHYFQIISVANHSDILWGTAVATAIHSVDPHRLLAAPSIWSNISQVGVINYGAYAQPGDLDPSNSHPMAMDETGAYDSVNEYRHSFWRWMLAGGSSIDNLDWSFCQGGYEDGSLPASEQHNPHQGGAEIRRLLSLLVSFFNSIDFVRMRSDSSWAKGVCDHVCDSDFVGLLAFKGSPHGAGLLSGNATSVLISVHVQIHPRCCIEFFDTRHGNSTVPTCVSTASQGQWWNQSIPLPTYQEDIAIRMSCMSEVRSTYV